jgi:SAM-dependent methyltransferase
MGQGRNALFLAEKGWRVTGFDISEEGVKQALTAAEKNELKIAATVAPAQEFDWGTAKWDLIVVTYFPFLRQMMPKIRESLKPGGLVVVEAYHADMAKERPRGPSPGVTFASNELLKVFEGFRVLRYEDTRAVADWGLIDAPLVRLCAKKE